MVSKKKPILPKFPPPRNSNTAHDADHVLYMGRTGSGKTTAVKKLGRVPKGSQAVFFDPYENYASKVFQKQRVIRYTEFLPFYRALVKARNTKGGFKIALVMPPTAHNVELFSQMVWSVGDGNKPKLHVVLEELATASDTTAKLKGAAGELWRGGRQYGLVMHSVFQKMQEVPKTVTSSTPNWWVGAVTGFDANAIAKMHFIDVKNVTKLKAPKDNNGMADYVFITEENSIDGLIHGQIDCRK